MRRRCDYSILVKAAKSIIIRDVDEFSTSKTLLAAMEQHQNQQNEEKAVTLCWSLYFLAAAAAEERIKTEYNLLDVT